MSSRAARGRQVLIAAMSRADAEAALLVAQSVLEWAPATPTGLVVEAAMADLVMSARQQLVTTGGALRPVPSRDHARRMADSEARTLEGHLARAPLPSSAPWSFGFATGDLISRACEIIVDEDILILAQRPILRGRGPVLLAGEHSETAQALAEALARRIAATVTEYPTGPEQSAADILSRIDRCHAAVVVVDLTTGPLDSEGDLRRLFAAARCPVIVLGASRLHRESASEKEAPQ